MKYIISVILIALSLGVSAQDTYDGPKNEVKLNGLYLVLGVLELDYEHILNEESSIGISAGVALDDDIAYKWAVIPRYRLFFGKKPAQGFFVEGHAAILEHDSSFILFSGNGFTISQNNEVVAGVGLSIGGKFRTKRNVIVEIVLGLGRTFGSDNISTYPRSGISIGKRF